MPSLVLAEARLARKYGAALSMSGWSARVSRASADSLRHVADCRSVSRPEASLTYPGGVNANARGIAKIGGGCSSGSTRVNQQQTEVVDTWKRYWPCG